VIAAKLPDDIDSVLRHSTHVAHRTMTHKHEDIEALIAELRETESTGAASVEQA